jgi:hypothetical protein
MINLYRPNKGHDKHFYGSILGKSLIAKLRLGSALCPELPEERPQQKLVCHRIFKTF